MNIRELAKTIELNVVNDPNLFGEPIVYTRLNGIEDPLEINATPLADEAMLIKNDPDLVIGDWLMFMSVELATPPVQGDKITYDGQTWYVMRYLGNNPYDIMSSSNRNHSGSRSRRRG